MNDGHKISVQGGQTLGQNPFGALNAAGLPVAPTGGVSRSSVAQAVTKNRGRVDILR